MFIFFSIIKMNVIGQMNKQKNEKKGNFLKPNDPNEVYIYMFYFKSKRKWLMIS